MSGFDEIVSMDAMAQAELVRKKEVKPLELVDAAIERIERLNPELNAVITPMYDQGRAAASGDIGQGPFAGVPFLLKDLGAMYAGVRLTLGARIMEGFVPDVDSELTIRQKRAGLITIGKTNTPEFGLLPTTEPELFGPTRNPWGAGHTPGGSSGGSAAAVAAGLVPMAHGNDGGGSIRIPASCCGVFGLKPTRARNPLGPLFGDMLGGLVAEHALTRSVRDSAALLDATSGPDLGDPYWAPPPARPFLEEVGADPGRLRIAVTARNATGTAVHPDCLAALKDAAELCAGLGHLVEEVDPPQVGEHLLHSFTVVWAAGCASTVDGVFGDQATAEMFEPVTWGLCEMGRHFTSSQYLIAVTGLQGAARQLAQFMTKYDLILTPTLAEPPLPLGSFGPTPDNPLAGWHRSATFAAYTPICNATGQPAMSVPLYWNNEGLPVGVHFIGRFGDEATLFRMAAQLEQARPWADRHPVVSAWTR